jgi:hypothetical protein
MGPFGRPLPPFLSGFGDIMSSIFNDIKKKNPLEHHPQPSPFGLPHLSLFNDFHELPEIEVIDIDFDDLPTEIKKDEKPAEEPIKVQKIG